MKMKKTTVNKKKLFMTSLILLMSISLLAACGASKDGGSSGGGSGKHAIIFKNTGNPYGEKMMQGFEEVITELGYEAILKAPDQPTAEAQISMIEELIAQKVDSIAIAGNDNDALQPALKKAMDRGIKVLSLDSAVNAQSRMVHVNQADPERIGRTLISGISEMIGGEGKLQY